MRTHYSTLSVSPTATREEIKQAYYGLRKQFFKLKRPTEPQKQRLVRINAAWDVLKLAERRRLYDDEMGIVDSVKPDADERHEESLRKTAAARKAASDAAAAAADRRSAAAAPDRQTKANGAPPPEQPPFGPGEADRWPDRKAHLPGGARYWALGAGIAITYLVLSMAVHRTVPPSPPGRPVIVDASATRAVPARPPARRHLAHRKRHVTHRSRATQSAADLNRLELQRLRDQHPTSRSPADPTS